jgi:DNA-3-methyladenine glycosylase II
MDIRQQLVKQDPNLKELFDHVGQLDMSLIIKQPYCALIGVIIGQKISYKRAKTLRSNLYQLLGTKFCCTDIESLSDNQLTSKIGLSKMQIERIRKVNKHLIEKGMDKHSYKFTKNDIEDLATLPGIGKWTVESTLLTSFPNVDIIPTGDLFIANRIKKLYNLQKKPSPEEIEHMSRKWKPHRGLVTWYLWRYFV